MAIIIEEWDIKKSCLYCKYFESYRLVYEDNNEPVNYGICTNDDIDDDLTFGEGMSCSLREHW